VDGCFIAKAKNLLLFASAFSRRKEEKMSKKISLQNKSGLPPWALTDLLHIARQFHCHVSIHNGEIMIDVKKLLEVLSLIRANVSKVEVNLQGDDEEEAFKSIEDSQVGRFVLQKA
jgi:phosphotransferase system HPr-like phosphotransfer protein